MQDIDSNIEYVIEDDLKNQLNKIQDFFSEKMSFQDDQCFESEPLRFPRKVLGISLSANRFDQSKGYVGMILYDTKLDQIIMEKSQYIDLTSLKYKNLEQTREYIKKHDPTQKLDQELFPLKLNINDDQPFPYITNYLSFREVEPFYETISDLYKNDPNQKPDLILVEGGGSLHPRKCGLATHLGVLINIPTIGVTKKLLMIKGWSFPRIKKIEKELDNGDSFEIDLDGQVVARGWKPLSSKRLIYVSVGHKVSVKTALEVVEELSDFRMPEPLRLAILLARQTRKEYL